MAIFFGNPWQDETYEVLNMTIGEKIKQRRKELGISGYRLAKIVEVSNSCIYHIENGTRKVSKHLLKSICQALNLNPETLEPIEIPKRSAWDELNNVEIDGPDWLDMTPIRNWTEKYKEELKQITAKEYL